MEDIPIKWINAGRDKIEYSRRIEVIPSSVYMREWEVKREISKILFEKDILSYISDHFGIGNILQISIEHVSCWLTYHVFKVEIESDEITRVALNLVPPSEKRGIFLEYRDISHKAYMTGVIPKPIFISDDGRFFLQEWVEGDVVSEITGEEWIKNRDVVLAMIAESLRKLFEENIIFYPINDYEIIIKDDKAVFLDITRLKEAYDKKIEECYRNSQIKNLPVIEILRRYP
jgi:hypothetical protein